MYEPVLVSKRKWDRLSEDQQNALLRAGEKAEDFFFAEAQQLDLDMEKTFSDAGVEVVHMDSEQASLWKNLAIETSYRVFSEEVEGGEELIRQALSVE